MGHRALILRVLDFSDDPVRSAIVARDLGTRCVVHIEFSLVLNGEQQPADIGSEVEKIARLIEVRADATSRDVVAGRVTAQRLGSGLCAPQQCGCEMEIAIEVARALGALFPRNRHERLGLFEWINNRRR